MGQYKIYARFQLDGDATDHDRQQRFIAALQTHAYDEGGMAGHFAITAWQENGLVVEFRRELGDDSEYAAGTVSRGVRRGQSSPVHDYRGTRLPRFGQRSCTGLSRCRHVVPKI